MTDLKKEIFRRLEDLEPLNSVPLHQRIYDQILCGGLAYSPDTAEDHAEGMELLRELLQIQELTRDTDRWFSDWFGVYMEETGQTSEKTGQFFTPEDLAGMTTQMIISPDANDSQSICDPSAGTGRFMLQTAKLYAEKIGRFNFFFTNIDIELKAFTFCSMNAILRDIPAICIWGNTLSVEVYGAFAVLPLPMGTRWERVPKEAAKGLIVQAKEQAKTRQTTLFAQEAGHVSC